MIKSDVFISVILVVQNQSEQLVSYVEMLSPYLAEHLEDYEIIIVDRRSDDGLEYKIMALLNQYPSIRYIRLSRADTSEVSLAAGLENAIGDVALNPNIESDDVKIIILPL